MNFDTLFDSYTEEAFRLESLPCYKVDEEAEAMKHFRKTGLIYKNLNASWIALLEKSRQRKKRVSRLRLLHEPLTLYEEFELAAYRRNIEVGEDIRSLPVKEFESIPNDFWLFDMKWICAMDYAEDGSFLSMDCRKATPEEIREAVYWKKSFERAQKMGV